MNESQTRLEKIDPALKRAGWNVVEDSHIIVELLITNGRVSRSVAPKPLKADYVLSYKGVKLAIVEAKSDEKDVSDGVAQAKKHAQTCYPFNLCNQWRQDIRNGYADRRRGGSDGISDTRTVVVLDFRGQ